MSDAIANAAPCDRPDEAATDEAPPIRWTAHDAHTPPAPGETLIDLTQAGRGDDAVLVRGPTISQDPWTGAHPPPAGDGTTPGHANGNGATNGNGHAPPGAREGDSDVPDLDSDVVDDAHDAVLDEYNYDDAHTVLSRATIARRVLTVVAVLTAFAFAATSVLLWQRVEATRRELAGQHLKVAAAPAPDLTPVQNHVAQLEARLASLLAASNDPTRASDVAPQIDAVRQELDSVHACLAAFQRAIDAGAGAASAVDYC